MTRQYSLHSCIAVGLVMVRVASLFTLASGRDRLSASPVYNGRANQMSPSPTAVSSLEYDNGIQSKRTVNVSRPSTLCDVKSVDPNMPQRIALARDSGTEMLTYTLHFSDVDGYFYKPLKTNVRHYFKGNQWRTVFSNHGRTLLSLPFNYDVLSLLMLTFRTELLNVQLLDCPGGCLDKLSEEEKFYKIKKLIIDNFQTGRISGATKHEEVCTEIIRDQHGQAEFTFECCKRSEESSDIRCWEQNTNAYIKALYTLIAWLKLTLLFFGPILLHRLIDSRDLGATNYIITLKDKLKKTLLLKKVSPDNISSTQQKEMSQFCKFRKLLKSVPSDEIAPVEFEKLHILVDHQKLYSDKYIPTGLFHFLYRNVLLCGFQRYEPFLTCCRESIFGSWSPKFLWFRLKNECECNRGCRQLLSWGHCFRLLGLVIVLALIPLPFYIRAILFYLFEEEEVNDRLDAANKIGLDIAYDHNLYQYLTPTHAVLICLYVTQAASSVLLAALHQCDPAKFDHIFKGAIQDFKALKRGECFRLLLAHLVLPFEKFGLFGLLVVLIYWPLAIPVCLLVAACYSIPTLYLAGRFVLQRRPEFVTTKLLSSKTIQRKRDDDIENINTLSNGTTSLETALLLENISPADKDESDIGYSNEKRYDSNSGGWRSRLVDIAIGVLLTTSMCCMQVAFAECFGYAVEMLALTLMGTIVNASSGVRYMILAFWTVIYFGSCYNNAHGEYLRLNKRLFEFMKEKLNADVDALTNRGHANKKNLGFKYFSMTELQNLMGRDVEPEFSSDSDSPEEVAEDDARWGSFSKYTDTIELVNGKLCWKITCLTYFVDSKGRARIPKELFQQLCETREWSCLGLLKATKQLAYMLLFLIVLFIVVLVFGEFYETSTTTQLLLTLAIGFMPFLARFVLSPKEDDVFPNTSIFSRKLHCLIRNFSQTWPVHDLSFKLCKPNSEEVQRSQDHLGLNYSRQAANDLQKGAHASVDPLHVDLLITIKDDPYEDSGGEHQNLRSGPESHGSRSSLTTKHSPDDSAKQHGVSKMPVNNPTNACLLSSATNQEQIQTPYVKLSSVVSEYPENAQNTLFTEVTPKRPLAPRTNDRVKDLSKDGTQVQFEHSQVEPADKSIAMLALDYSKSRYSLKVEAESEL